ncbi:MAG: selenide, water dikinase SelD, partial [candidate division Zixibacteria bacterium]|nr:selenide, water dikinase SelD [candidate division Zixibacteria bacterium]
MRNTVFERELVLIGGGHAHVQVVKKIGMGLSLPGVRVTLIADRPVAWYSGMLPGCLAGLYTPDEIGVELRPLARWAGVRFVQATVSGIDPYLRQVVFDDRPSIGYDVLSLNIGSQTRGMDLPGVRAFAIPTRPLGTLLEKLSIFESDFVPGDGPPQVVVTGAGAAGVELAIAMRLRWQKRFGPVSVLLADAHPDVLMSHALNVRRMVRQRLDKYGIRHVADARVERVELDTLYLSDGSIHRFDVLLWATGGAPPALIARSGLDTDDAGFVRVGQTLQTLRFPDVFAVGDCAHFDDRPLPKAGVYAVRQGPVLAENLSRFFHGTTLKPYRPQRAFLSLLLTGNREATASWRGLAPHGPLLWRLKDRIDRKWMRKFDPNHLPVMFPVNPESPADPAMRCAGCGAKVGSTVLTGVLDALPRTPNARVVVGLDAADDAAVLRYAPDVWIAQTVDGFRAFIDDLYLFGRIAFVHAVSDVYAMGGRPDTALVMITLPYAARHLMTEDLRQIMNGLADEAVRHHTAIVGGHTAEGAEPAIGIVVNGLLDNRLPFTKTGLVPGDRLVLTKPLGTGVVLAADMHARSRGNWMDAAIASMTQHNGAAVEIFRHAGAVAVTDVTGFGLAGHLVEMLDASGTGAALNLARIPFLPGAYECIDRGIRSTLAPSNREHLEKRWHVVLDGTPNDEILYDPQTSGGLLAGVPAMRVEETLSAL